MADPHESGFSPEETEILSSVLDQIIPPSRDGKLPGAGELGVARYIDRITRTMPELRAMVIEGLAALAEFAASRKAPSFAALSNEEKRQAVEEQGFLPILVLHTFAGYYQESRVLAGLGLEPRPPHPKGYEMEPNDLTIVDQVRRRPKTYRERYSAG